MYSSMMHDDNNIIILLNIYVLLEFPHSVGRGGGGRGGEGKGGVLVCGGCCIGEQGVQSRRVESYLVGAFAIHNIGGRK